MSETEMLEDPEEGVGVPDGYRKVRFRAYGDASDQEKMVAEWIIENSNGEYDTGDLETARWSKQDLFKETKRLEIIILFEAKNPLDQPVFWIVGWDSEEGEDILELGRELPLPEHLYLSPRWDERRGRTMASLEEGRTINYVYEEDEGEYIVVRPG